MCFFAELKIATCKTDHESKYVDQTAIEGSSYKMKCSGVVGLEPLLASVDTIVIWSVNGSLPRGLENLI